MYKRIESNIADGRCPHVRLVNNGGLSETSVNGFHVAAAVDSEVPGNNIGSGIFELSPVDIACVKRKHMSAKTYQQLFSQTFHDHAYGDQFGIFPTYEKLLCYKDYDKGDGHITVSKMSYLDLFLRLEDSAKLNNILSCSFHTSEHLKQGICYAMKSDLKDLQETLAGRGGNSPLTGLAIDRASAVWYFIKSAIMYNCPDILLTVIERVLKDATNTPPMNFPPHYDERRRAFLASFEARETARRGVSQQHLIDNLKTASKVCDVMDRQTCKEVFATLDVVHEGTVSESDRLTELLCLLKEFYDDFKDELVALIKQIPNFKENCESYLNRTIVYLAETPHVVSEILALGVEINGNNNLFYGILTRFNLNDSKVRETAKVILNENPDLDKQLGVVEMAIVQDEQLYRRDRVILSGSYNCDTKVHGLLESDGHDLALNFAAPFLLECGFPVSREALQSALSKTLHPTETKYIQTYLDSPKPLAMACRDTIRNKLKGKKLGEFLKTSKCPKAIQDIILMKSLLNTH